MTATVATRAESAAPDRQAVLTVRDLAKTYNPATPKAKEAIRRLNFSAYEGELICIVGPSGAGKTTLLRCLSGLSPATAGGAYFNGKLVEQPPPEIAIVFQDYGRSLFPWLTVASNIALPMKAKGIRSKERREAVERSLHSVGLPDVGHFHPWQLSGGMQQRVAIARALAYQPKLLLMDEPFASVDAQTRFELEDLILRVRTEYGMTIVFVTHDIDEAVYVGNRIVVLSPSPCEVKAEISVPLPAVRSQMETRRDPAFIGLRTEVFQLATGGDTARAQ